MIWKWLAIWAFLGAGWAGAQEMQEEPISYAGVNLFEGGAPVGKST